MAPKDRVDDAVDGTVTFFPNEVARLLAIENIDYSQMRAFYRLIKDPSGVAGVSRGWSRYTFADIASLVVAVELCGGPAALVEGRRLTHARLSAACAALHAQGYLHPLLDVRLRRYGREIVAEVDGLVLDPVTGQIQIRAAADRADVFFSGQLLRDPDVAEALRIEVERHRKA